MNLISAIEAYKIMEKQDSIVILDVRTEEEFKKGHIKGARLLPYDRIDMDTADDIIGDLNTKILLYCRTGKRAAIAMQTLENLEFTDVSSFGGIDSWPFEVVVEQ